MSNSDEDWLESIKKALIAGKSFINTSQEYDLGCDHVIQLFNDASLLLKSGSHASAVFLIITALEEIAKLHISVYRNSSNPAPRNKDLLFSHFHKHNLAVAPTIALGSRLQKTIGETRMQYFINLVRDNKLISIRENSLYMDVSNNKLEIPSQIITSVFARELMLFAIEAFDDGLVGYTDHSVNLSKVTDSLFSYWENTNLSR